MGTKKPHMRCGFCRTYGIQDANPDTRSFRVQAQHTKKPSVWQAVPRHPESTISNWPMACTNGAVSDRAKPSATISRAMPIHTRMNGLA